MFESRDVSQMTSFMDNDIIDIESISRTRVLQDFQKKMVWILTVEFTGTTIVFT